MCGDSAVKNITLAIDEKTIKSARAYAKARGTTLNALVRSHLAELLTQESRQEQARKRLLELAESSTGEMGKGFKFNREEMYEARLFPGHKRASVRGGGKKT
jgi:hypothetical protein